MIVGATYYYFTMKRHPPDFGDFNVYYVAGQKALKHLTVYDVQGHYQYKYAPFVSLIFALMTTLSTNYTALTVGYYILSAVMCVGWVGYCAIYPNSLKPKSEKLFHFLALLVFFVVPIREELKLGQSNWVPLWLMVLATAMRERKTQTAQLSAGLLVGFAIQFKLYAAFLLLDWVFRRAWKALAGVVLSFIIATLIFALYNSPSFALSENLAWVSSLFHSSEILLGQKYNIAMIGFFMKAGFPKSLTLALWGLALGGFVLLQKRLTDKTSGWNSMAFSFLGVIAFNPLSWPYWLLFAAPSVAITLNPPTGNQSKAAAFGLLLLGLASYLQDNNYDYYFGGIFWATLWLIGLTLYKLDTA